MVELAQLGSNSVIIVAGPTASGKSALALQLAQKYQGEIVNADSMQIYRGLPILSAALSEEDKKIVPHHLYEIYEPAVNGTVVDWLDLAVAKIQEIRQRGNIPLVVGGTGMYIDNLLNGTTPIPPTDENIRQRVMAWQQELGQAALYEKLQQTDPQGAALVKPNDTTRVRRALEIFCQTGISIVEWFKRPLLKRLPDADFHVVKIIPPTPELDERCYQRLDIMLQQGALQEVEKLLELKLNPSLPAMKMLGVPELASYLQGRVSLTEARNLAKLHTRQYAKRQRTWFRNKLPAEVTITECCK